MSAEENRLEAFQLLIALNCESTETCVSTGTIKITENFSITFKADLNAVIIK